MADSVPETFFARVKRLGPREVSRQLGFDDGFMSRCSRGLVGINEGVVAKCEEVWGQSFDRPGTLAEWYELRTARRAESQRPSDVEPEAAHTPDAGA